MNAKSSPLNKKECPYYNSFVGSGLSNCEYTKDKTTYCGVKPTRKNIDISLAKCNTEPHYPIDDLQEYVEEICFNYYKLELTASVLTPESTLYVNRKSSPAKFWKEKGCKTKGDALEHEDFTKYVWSTDHTPCVDYNGKIELLPIEDIMINNKIRGTFNPPLDFIMKQKYLFDTQNGNICDSNESKWIKHGFVKQYGGFHRLAETLEFATLIDSDDCKGYDREIYLIGAYRLRWRGFIGKSLFGLLFIYCMTFVMYAFVICADGVVRCRKTGNISGSNNTTTDNSLAHMLIYIRFICKLWFFFNKRLPTYEEIFRYHVAAIYSDDAVGAHFTPILTNFDVKEFNNIKVEVYKEFGLVFKPKQQQRFLKEPYTRIPNELQFLGSTFYYEKALSMYLPVPNIDRIVSGLKYVTDTHDPLDVVFKALALTILSSTVPILYDECRSFLNFLLTTIPLEYGDFPEHLNDLVQRSYTPCVWYGILAGRECGWRSVFETNMSRKSTYVNTSNNKTKQNVSNQGVPRRKTLGVDSVAELNKRNRALMANLPKPQITQNRIVKIDPNKAEKYRREGEARLREQMLKAENEKLQAKRNKNKEKKQRKKEKKAEGNWWDPIVDVGKSLITHGLPLLLGMGDYTEDDGVLSEQKQAPQTNSLLAAATNGKLGTQCPIMHSVGNRTSVRHREYLGDIYSSTSEFINETFPINPGMNETFPWLSPQGNQYTGYDVKGMVVEFISEGSEYTNSAGLGFVATGVQYDPVEEKFETKRDMLNSMFSVAVKPSKSMQCWVECQKNERILDHLFIRSGDPPPNTDIRLYDLGTLNVAVGGNVVSDVIIGELWIAYDIDLMIPRSSLNINPNQLQFAALTSSGVANATPLGSSWTESSLIEDTFQLDYVSGTVFNTKKNYPGRYLITYRWTFGGTVGTATVLPTVTYTGGASLANTYGNAGVGMTAAGTGTSMSLTQIISITDKAGVVTFGTGGNLAFTPTFSITIVQLFDAPSRRKTVIFDPLGKKRSTKYNNAMEKISRKEEVKDNNVIILRSSQCYSFVQIQSFFYVRAVDTGIMVPADSFIVDYDTVSDEEFDTICREFFEKSFKPLINARANRLNPNYSATPY